MESIGNYIFCPGCGDIRPLLVDRMNGTDSSGKFGKPTDLMCGDCHLVITTTYQPLHSETEPARAIASATA